MLLFIGLMLYSFIIMMITTIVFTPAGSILLYLTVDPFQNKDTQDVWI